MVKYSKKPGKKRAIRKQPSKKGKRSGKSPRRSRLLKAVKKRRKTKLRGGDDTPKICYGCYKSDKGHMYEFIDIDLDLIEGNTTSIFTETEEDEIMKKIKPKNPLLLKITVDAIKLISSIYAILQIYVDVNNTHISEEQELTLGKIKSSLEQQYLFLDNVGNIEHVGGANANDFNKQFLAFMKKGHTGANSPSMAVPPIFGKKKTDAGGVGQTPKISEGRFIPEVVLKDADFGIEESVERSAKQIIYNQICQCQAYLDLQNEIASALHDNSVKKTTFGQMFFPKKTDHEHDLDTQNVTSKLSDRAERVLGAIRKRLPYTLPYIRPTNSFSGMYDDRRTRIIEIDERATSTRLRDIYGETLQLSQYEIITNLLRELRTTHSGLMAKTIRIGKRKKPELPRLSTGNPVYEHTYGDDAYRQAERQRSRVYRSDTAYDVPDDPPADTPPLIPAKNEFYKVQQQLFKLNSNFESNVALVEPLVTEMKEQYGNTSDGLSANTIARGVVDLAYRSSGYTDPSSAVRSRQILTATDDVDVDPVADPAFEDAPLLYEVTNLLGEHGQIIPAPRNRYRVGIRHPPPG